MTLQKKIDQSLFLIESLNKPENPYCVGFSGGKDSIVVLDLAIRSGVDFTAQYSNTTLDPPGTISFIKNNYPAVEIIHPKKSFFELIEQKGLPTRTSRFCCEYLKENHGKGKRTIDGTRRAESFGRSKYTPEDCDTRKAMKGAVHIRPIVYWTDAEVWQYIRKNDLPYIKYYDAPYSFSRHGCIGCPLAGVKQQMIEFKLFPGYARAILRSIAKNMELKPNNIFAQKFSNEYEVFHWWLSGYSTKEYFSLRDQSLFNINHKELIHKSFFNQ